VEGLATIEQLQEQAVLVVLVAAALVRLVRHHLIVHLVLLEQPIQAAVVAVALT